MNRTVSIIKDRLLALIVMAAVMCQTACNEDVLSYVKGNRNSLTIKVADRRNGLTRAAYSKYSLTFESGDRIGLYVYDGSSVVASNVLFEYDGISWTTEENIEYDSDCTYYAYYPYTATPYTPDFTQSTVDEIFSSFITDSSDKFHHADQSVKANFNGSDLMIAEGVGDGEGSVSFTLDHKKALAVLIGTDAITFSGNIPYTVSEDRKYFMMKPSTATVIGGYTMSATGGRYMKKDFSNMSNVEPLKFTALEDGSFTLSIPSGLTAATLGYVSYSIDDGETWVKTLNDGTGKTITVDVEEGDEVLWKGSGIAMAISESVYSQFSSTGSFEASGSVGSIAGVSIYSYYKLFNGCTGLTTAPELPSSVVQNYCYAYMFQGCTSLTTAPELPATTLALNCYQDMFSGCTSLTAAPELPATTLALNCYQDMFSGCTSLTAAPELPATTLAANCYRNMFNNCTSLITIPTDLLPATTLSSYCYQDMFRSCSSLTNVPELPATTLATSCYYRMFEGCTSLTTAPELPATIMGDQCYRQMFKNCTSLTTVPELPATTLANACYTSMFNGCTSLTTAPELPATTLASNCYQYMFKECSSLTTAPELAATTLEANCYQEMFMYCTGLTTAPDLPATTLADACYSSMFNGCTSLTTAPELPATTLANACYQNMFYYCRALTTAPELPAMTLAESCYQNMFKYCTSLRYIKMMANDISATACLDNWLSNVARSGTFVKSAAMTSLPSGEHGIPTGWTVIDE